MTNKNSLNQEMPNAKEVEAGILSAILTIPNNIFNCIQLLNDECFYQRKYQLIWIEIVKMHNEGDKIDMVTLTQRLSDNGKLDSIGGMSTIIDLMSYYLSGDVDGCAKILYEKYVRRKGIEEAHILIQKCYDQSNDIFDVISRSKDKLTQSLSPNVSRSINAQEIIIDMLQDISDNLGTYQEVTGVPTGFESFDVRMGGFSDEGDLYILAGRPSMGKTTIMINATWNAYSKFGHSGMFFSCEMSKKQIARMIIAKESGISTDDLKKRKLTDTQADHLFNVFSNKKEGVYLIDDTPNAQLSYIMAEATKAHQKYGIKWVVVDYLQLISTTKGANRTAEIEEISKGLKSLASNLKIPVIALAQLSRDVEKRGGDKRPILADLRDGGSIEQDASAVTFIFRPEYYGITKTEDGMSLEGITELITRKHRHGEIGIDYLFMDKKTSNFENFDIKTGQSKSVDNYDMRLVSPQKMEAINDFDTNNFSFTNKMIQANGENETPF